MNALILSALNAPNDLWSKLIYLINGAFGNFGWTILFVTLLVKLIMAPLDFMVKYSNKKQTLIQKKLSPQIAKIKKKFGNNEQQVRIQTQSLYKREGLKVGASCIIMAVNMLATMLVFFTFYSSIKKVSAYEMITQYQTLEQTMENKYASSIREKTGDNSIVDYAAAYSWYDTNITNGDASTDEYQNCLVYHKQAEQEALNQMISTWESTKDNWLWVSNIWVADAPTAPLASYDKLLSMGSNGGYEDYIKENINKDNYNRIANTITRDAKRSKNGFYIVTIIVGLLSFLSQWIADLHTKLRNKKAQKLATVSDPSQTTMKIMKIIMPIIMVGFALTSATSFGLYLIASSIASIAFGEITALIIRKLTKKQQEEVEAVLEKEADRLIKKGKLQEN